MRVAAQRLEVDRRISGMRSRTSLDECVITIDFKMKYQPIAYRETTVGHFGKRGISWHGAMVHVFLPAQEVYSDGVPEGTDADEPVMQTFYYHTVEAGESYTGLFI